MKVAWIFEQLKQLLTWLHLHFRLASNNKMPNSLSVRKCELTRNSKCDSRGWLARFELVWWSFSACPAPEWYPIAMAPNFPYPHSTSFYWKPRSVGLSHLRFSVEDNSELYIPGDQEPWIILTSSALMSTNGWSLTSSRNRPPTPKSMPDFASASVV